jgi:hypothetical protein
MFVTRITRAPKAHRTEPPRVDLPGAPLLPQMVWHLSRVRTATVFAIVALSREFGSL